jgi:ribosomal protein L7/L12
MELDDVLAELRNRGASIVDSLKIVRDVEHVSLGQAKAIVDQSLTWADARQHNRELRDAVLEALDDVDD